MNEPAARVDQADATPAIINLIKKGNEALKMMATRVAIEMGNIQ